MEKRGQVIHSPSLWAVFVSTLCCVLFPMTASSGPADTSVSSDQSPAVATASQGVRGHVKSAAGEPMAGVVVLAKSLDKPAPAIPDIAILTNAAGSYFWPLAPGNYDLTFLQDGRKLASRRVAVRKNRLTQADVLTARRGTFEQPK